MPEKAAARIAQQVQQVELRLVSLLPSVQAPADSNREKNLFGPGGCAGALNRQNALGPSIQGELAEERSTAGFERSLPVFWSGGEV